MTQSYVGKRTLSKGIGGVIRRFAYSSFKFYAFGCRGRVSRRTAPGGTSFCAVAMVQDVVIPVGKGWAAPACCSPLIKAGDLPRRARLAGQCQNGLLQVANAGEVTWDAVARIDCGKPAENGALL